MKNRTCVKFWRLSHQSKQPSIILRLALPLVFPEINGRWFFKVISQQHSPISESFSFHREDLPSLPRDVNGAKRTQGVLWRKSLGQNFPVNRIFKISYKISMKYQFRSHSVFNPQDVSKTDRKQEEPLNKTVKQDVKPYRCVACILEPCVKR